MWWTYTDEGRFELEVGRATSPSSSTGSRGAYLVLVHTEVPEALEGEGVGRPAGSGGRRPAPPGTA